MTENTPRIETQTDLLDPARATALAATLGSPQVYTTGDALPHFAHQIYFWEPRPPSALGPDGHPATGGFIPDLGLPRRMWAAGRLAFHQPLRAGIKADKNSVVESTARKTGRSGPLAFVRVRHDIRQRGTPVLTEWQELVYRADGSSAAPAVPAPMDETASETRATDSTLLFRYSALTFNGHRIHYDADYARDVEGYAGLVVHGPLLAHWLMNFAAAQLGTLTTFSYRATGPLIAGETATLCWRNGHCWVRGPDGRMCMKADAA